MTHAQAVKALDQLIDGLKRAEESKKDVDLLMTMRIVYMILEDIVKYSGIVNALEYQGYIKGVTDTLNQHT